MMDGDMNHPCSGVTNLPLTKAQQDEHDQQHVFVPDRTVKQDFPAIAWLEWHRFKTPGTARIVSRSTSLQI